jgi:hypothetical protein
MELRGIPVSQVANEVSDAPARIAGQEFFLAGK